ncbi:MAG: type I secretion C-terminal target domain-containing protein, partial [Zoogloea sp.]|nr:type I secretion C-terminal target domain-containing protein [Zoogloea sp.]
GTVIAGADITNWQNFLSANKIISFALGLGSANQVNLDPVAFNGLTNTDMNGQLITSYDQLSGTLQATVGQSTSGDILSGGLLGGTSGFGADGGHIESITVDGITYTYDPQAAGGAGSVTPSGGSGTGTYDAASHVFTIKTADGGTLLVNLSTGSYSYTPKATVTAPIVDGFSFVLVDKDGDHAGAEVTFNVSRTAENTIALTSTTTAISATSLGLTGEYYGYNDSTNASITRTHTDDRTLGNLDHVSDMTTIVNGRSGTTVVGTNNAAPASGADATFSADKIDYGFGYSTTTSGTTTTVGAVDGNLGNNPTVGANLAVNSGALYNFLRGGTAGSDASTLKTTTGLGYTTDSGLRFVGLMNVAGGNYDIRITADDGFRINVDGQTVAMFDNIQSPTTRVFQNVGMVSGLHPIEILYWEQGGNARLRIEVKLHSEADTAYKTLGTDDFALFTPTSAPTLSETQDIIESSTQNGSWLVQTGAQTGGTDANDHITGSTGQDIINGGLGNDVIIGGANENTLSGGAGNDTLTGGLGSDVFKWSLGDAGSTSQPAIDAITDFNKAAPLDGGDVLDLRELLQGESHSGTAVGNLGSYLHFERSGSDTVVHVSSNGGYTGGTFNPGATDQKIVLQGVDLTNSGALTNDTQIIQDLLTKGKLNAD